MRALILSQMNKHDQAMEQIKKTLSNPANFKNFTCWHVYGMIQKKNKDYSSARKLYLAAQKINPENDAVLRDLSCVQLHLRDFAGLQETRRLILLKSPDNRENWTSYAVACFLNKDYEKTISVVESVEKFMTENANSPNKQWSLIPVQIMEIYKLKLKSLIAQNQF